MESSPSYDTHRSRLLRLAQWRTAGHRPRSLRWYVVTTASRDTVYRDHTIGVDNNAAIVLVTGRAVLRHSNANSKECVAVAIDPSLGPR